MSTVRATIDVTVRKTVVMDLDDDGYLFWPSLIGQMIQQDVIGDDERAVEFHSVSWERV